MERLLFRWETVHEHTTSQDIPIVKICLIF